MYNRVLLIELLDSLYCDKTRSGKFKVGRKTSSKKFRQKMKDMSPWLKGVRNRVKLEVWWPLLRQKLVGHYQYYGISGNIKGLQTKIYHFYSDGVHSNPGANTPIRGGL